MCEWITYDLGSLIFLGKDLLIQKVIDYNIHTACKKIGNASNGIFILNDFIRNIRVFIQEALCHIVGGCTFLYCYLQAITVSQALDGVCIFGIFFYRKDHTAVAIGFGHVHDLAALICFIHGCDGKIIFSVLDGWNNGLEFHVCHFHIHPQLICNILSQVNVKPYNIVVVITVLKRYISSGCYCDHAFFLDCFNVVSVFPVYCCSVICTLCIYRSKSGHDHRCCCKKCHCFCCFSHNDFSSLTLAGTDSLRRKYYLIFQLMIRKKAA